MPKPLVPAVKYAFPANSLFLGCIVIGTPSILAAFSNLETVGEQDVQRVRGAIGSQTGWSDAPADLRENLMARSSGRNRPTVDYVFGPCDGRRAV